MFSKHMVDICHMWYFGFNSVADLSQYSFNFIQTLCVSLQQAMKNWALYILRISYLTQNNVISFLLRGWLYLRYIIEYIFITPNQLFPTFTFRLIGFA